MKRDLIVALCLLPIAFVWMLGVALFNARHHLFATACFTYVALVVTALLSHTACLQFFPRFSGFFFLLALITGELISQNEYR